MTSVLSFFLFCTNKHKKRKNDKWLLFYRFSIYIRKHTKTYKRKLTSVLSLFVVSTTNQWTGYNLIFLFFIFIFSFSLAVQVNQELGQRGGRGGEGGGGVWGLVVPLGNSSRCCWSAVFITVVWVFFLGSFKNGGEGKRSYCSPRERACWRARQNTQRSSWYFKTTASRSEWNIRGVSGDFVLRMAYGVMILVWLVLMFIMWLHLRLLRWLKLPFIILDSGSV